MLVYDSEIGEVYVKWIFTSATETAAVRQAVLDFCALS
jgi:hypothetical protein